MIFFEREVKLNVEDLQGIIKINSYLKDNTHEMKVTLYVNPVSMEITDINGEMIRKPYEVCQSGLSKLERLVGLTVKSGINKKVAEIMGKTEGCVHIIELLRECFKGAIQGSLRYNLKNIEGDQRIKMLENSLKGTCLRYL